MAECYLHAREELPVNAERELSENPEPSPDSPTVRETQNNEEVEPSTAPTEPTESLTIDQLPPGPSRRVTEKESAVVNSRPESRTLPSNRKRDFRPGSATPPRNP